MIVAIADTHTTIWYLFSDSRLGKAASDFIDSAIASPSIYFQELTIDPTA
jgi:PIN domain nuclease of toxin-antitoxin system